MKPTKTNVQEFLKKLYAILAPFDSVIASLASANSDAQKFRAKIKRIGEPDYNDESAINELQAVTKKLQLCEVVIEKHEEQLETLDPKLRDILNDGGILAGSILCEVYDRRLATVKACLRPFFSSPEGCEQVAKQTEICQTAAHQVGRFYQIQHFSSRGGGIQAAKKIEAVLLESLKETPDLMQFLPFNPDPKNTAA